MMAGDFPLRIKGVVVRGRQQARVLGLPTANVEPDDQHCLAFTGIYAGYCQLAGETYPVLIYIGPSTLLRITATRLEVYLLNYSGDLYNQRVEISVEHRIRAPRPFATMAEAQAQLQEDLLRAKEYFGRHHYV